MGAILNNPDLAEAQKAFNALEDKPENSAIKNPAAFLDSAIMLVRHARAVEVRARMFRAAIATVLDGPEALAEYPEPNIGRRFIYEAQFRNRSMLKSTDETINGQPITLQVGRRPDIHTAAAAGDLEQINYLLESGTPVDHPDSERWTALHHAAQAGKREVIELLLKHGADLHALLSSEGGFMMDPAMAKRYGLKLVEVKLDEDARTALDLAMEAGHEALAEFLRQQGAKTSMELQKAVSTPRD
jgi:hypothetical protein